MSRKSLSSRLDGFSTAPGASRRRENARLRHEPLEDRRLLAAYINEIYWDPPSGGDAQFEYIELRGTASMSLDDYYFIIVENEGAPMGNPGDIDMIFDLTGTSVRHQRVSHAATVQQPSHQPIHGRRLGDQLRGRGCGFGWAWRPTTAATA